MDREFWNSQAAVVRPGEEIADVVVAIGRLHEMVASFLSHSPEQRRTLLLVGEAFEGSFGREKVQRLCERQDFPLVC